MRVLFYLLMYLFIANCTTSLVAQEASISNSIKDIIKSSNSNNNQYLDFSTDPVNTWPACSEPKGIVVSFDNENLSISWDKHLDSKSNIEYEVNLKAANSSGKSIKNSIIKTNKFEIEYTSLEGISEFSFNVRRVCKIAGKEVYSKWVVEEISIKNDTQLSTSDPCDDILNMISFINNPPDTTINDTLLLTNNDYDFIEIVFSGRHWVWDNRNVGTFDLLPFTKLLRVNKLKSIKVPFAQGYGLIYAVKKVKLFANEVDDPCLTTHLVDPKTFGCDSDAIISYTVDHTSTGNNIFLSILEGDDDVSATIYTSSGSYNTINGVVKFSTCDNFNIKLTVVKLINGKPTTSICDVINIENFCPCTNFTPSFGSDDLAIIHPSCTNTSGGIFVNVTGYISSIGGEFSDTHYYQNLAPGAYYIQFKSLANGCLTVPLLVIINPIPAMPDTPVFGINQQSGCNNQKGIISVQSPIGGHLYGYNSSSFSNNTIFQNLLPGTYIPKVKNIYGCISYGSPVTINSFPSSPTSPSVTITNPTCNAGTNTGTFYVTFPTGSQYTYSIDGINFQSSNVFNNVLPGTYTVTVKDINSNCSSSVGNKTVTPIPTPGVPTASVTTQPSCTLTTGTITITSPTGSQYRYSINGSTYSTSKTYSNLSPGVYNVTVKNTSTNCVSSPRQLTVNSILPSAAVTVQPTCNAPNGTIVFSGPTGSNIRYSINDGASYSTSVSFFNLSPGTYLCRFRNTSTGCTSNALSLVVNPVPKFAEPVINVTQPNCQDLYGIVSIASPTGANFQYSLDGGAYQTSINFYNVVPGFHTLIAKNTTDNCLSNPTQFIINDESLFSAKPVVVVNDPTCEIQSGTINIQSPIGNDFEYTVNNVNYFSNPVFQNLAPGNYTIKARSKSTGCISEGTTISISSIPLPPSNGPSIITTQLNCFSNTGSVNITAPVGDKIFYSLNNGEIQSASSFSGLVPGVYTIKSLDATSFCYSPATSFEILPFDNGTSQELNFDFFDQIDCETEGGNITILSPLGSEYEYSINNGPFQSSPNFINLSEDSYTIKYKNLNSGCLSEDSECTINTISCTPNPELICDILSSFDAIVQSENTISIVAPNDFLDVLALNNTSNNDIDYQYSLISSIKFSLDYTDNGTPKTLENEIYNSQMYPSFSDFDISSWSIVLEGVNTVLFEGQYTITILMKDGSTHICDPVTLNLISDPVTDEENVNSFEDLPVLDCTTELLIKDTSNPEPHTDLEDGDIIYIQAFPIQLTDVDPEAQSGRYSGFGILPIPFGSKNVLVEFNNVFVNIKNVITDGTVSVVRTEPTPALINPGPLSIGGDICIPPDASDSGNGSGVIDPYGFDPSTGLHTNGTTHDDNGFDINGNYEGTDPPSPFNPSGCNREGWSNDNPPKPCDPTAPVNPPLPEVVNFLSQNSGQINSSILSILNTLISDHNLKIANLGCTTIKNEVDGLNTNLGYNPIFTVGASSEYTTPSTLLDNFASKPLKDETKIEGKNPSTKDLEDRHVDLYECAVKSQKYQTIISLANDIINDTMKLNALKSNIKSKIEKWSSVEVAKYIGPENQDAFNEWLLTNIKKYLEQISNNPDLFAIIEKKSMIIKQRNMLQLDYIDHYNAIASINDFFPNVNDNPKNELEFYFNQDFQTIKGIDRAFYLEAMSKKISLNDIPNNVYTLPIEIKKQVGSYILTLLLDEISFTTTTGRLDAYIIVEDQETGRKIVFKGLDIDFNTNGPTGNNKMFLGNDVELKINNSAKLILNGNEDTFIQFNCEGFSGMGIDADVEFCRDFIIPLGPGPELTPLPDNELYRLNLKTTMSTWLDFDIEVDASNFSLAKYEDVKFELSKIVIDLNSQNSPSIPFPVGYQNAMKGSPGWKGFYASALNVVFPNEFTPDSPPAKAGIKDLIIDGTGVTAEGFYSGTILSLENGNIGGWGMSINYLKIKILQNHLSDFSMKGQIETPLFEEPFNYDASIYANKVYKFTVLPTTHLTCDLFLADAELTAGTGIEIKHDSIGFSVLATLNGTLTVKGSESANINFPKMEFTGLQISNRTPYFDAGKWSIPLEAGAKYAGFELSVKNPISYKPDPNDHKKAGLLITTKLSFDDGMSIALEGDLGIDGKLVLVGNKQKWKFEKIQVHEFCLTGSFPGVKKISGCINFFDEATSNGYGTGFKGGIKIEFETFLKEVVAIGQFGKIGNQRYFFVDASASLQTGIPVGPISLNGFSGGLSYHMSYSFNPDNLVFDDDAPLPTALGDGLSGMHYTPNFNVGLGLSAGAMFSIAKAEEIFNGSIVIKASWYKEGGGLEKMSLTGIGQFISPINLNLPIVNPAEKNSTKPSAVSSVISGYVHLEYIPGKFTGDIEAFLNAGGGIEGAGEGGKLVDANLEFTSSKWHIYIGVPEKGKRCGIKFGSFATIQSYLCMGTVIPDFPELPDEVKSLAPLVKSNSGLRGGGGGLLFGASFDVKASLNVIGIITGSAQAGGGFDVMLRKYNNMVCEGTTSEIGWNGWYAAGQAWAYIKGELSIVGINIIKAGIAAVLQARLPNPSWVQGTVGIKVESFLGDFDYDMKAEFGNSCNFVSNDPNNQLGMEVIASTNPIDSALDIPIDESINIFFNLPIDKVQKIKTLNGQEKEYIAKIKEISLKYGNNEISTKLNWNLSKNELKLIPNYYLPVYSDHTMKIVVEVFEDSMVIATEERIINFKTGGQLSKISESNILATYPMNGMQNFYKDEQENEYIYLNQGVYDILQNENYNIKLKLGSQYIPVNISDYARKIEFDISPYLTNQTHYQLELVRLPKANLNFGQTAKSNVQDSTVLYKIDFRTSKYNLFSEKVAMINQGNSIPVVFPTQKRVVDEPFDKFETFGDYKYLPLVRGYTQINDALLLSFLDDMVKAFPYYDEYTSKHCGIGEYNPYDMYIRFGEPIFIPFYDVNHIYMDFGNYYKTALIEAKTKCELCVAKIKLKEQGYLPDNEFYRTITSSPKDHVNSFEYKLAYRIPIDRKQGKVVSINNLNK